MAHILPHWNWPDRVGKVTPVHVFSSGDEAELFINGKSQGRQTKEELTYRFRWDNVTYQPGEVHVVAYKNGREWVTDTIRTTGEPAALRLQADRSVISADGVDLSFISVEVIDREGDVVPQAANSIQFSVSGAGQLVATDNGDASDYTAFPSAERQAFSGRVLVIVSGKDDKKGELVVKAAAAGLKSDEVIVRTE